MIPVTRRLIPKLLRTTQLINAQIFKTSNTSLLLAVSSATGRLGCLMSLLRVSRQRNRAPVNTLLADSSPYIAIPSSVVADIGSGYGAETAIDPSAQSAEDTAGSEMPLTSAIDIPLSASLEADKNRPKAHSSGPFRVAKTIVIDADTNDPQRAYQSNYKRRFAQAAVNPGIVIGYMNTLKKGPEGRSWANGDKRDIYLIDALGGEVINLIINYPSQADLDLYLQTAEGETLVTSVGSSPFEGLRLPNRIASYYLQVQFYGIGASSYSLSIGVDA